jgi:hypothetical protein
MQPVLPSTRLHRYRDGLQTMPWRLLCGYGMLTLFFGALFAAVLPHHWQRPYLHCLLAVPLIMLVAKDLACYPLACARWKMATARNAPLFERLLATQPPELGACLRLERAMWRGFFNWLLRRPQPARRSGTPLGYLARGSYGTVIGCALLALFVELPIDVLIASLLAKTPGEARMLHLIFGAFGAYGFVWVLGDRWHVQGRGHHFLTDTTLELDIGVRAFGSIPLDSIASCVRLKEARAEWCKRHGHFLHATRKVTPFDAPNLVLPLKPGSDVRLQLLQMERGGDGPVFLYLDRPELLCAHPALQRP